MRYCKLTPSVSANSQGSGETPEQSGSVQAFGRVDTYRVRPRRAQRTSERAFLFDRSSRRLHPSSECIQACRTGHSPSDSLGATNQQWLLGLMDEHVVLHPCSVDETPQPTIKNFVCLRRISEPPDVSKKALEVVVVSTDARVIGASECLHLRQEPQLMLMALVSDRVHPTPYRGGSSTAGPLLREGCSYQFVLTA